MASIMVWLETWEMSTIMPSLFIYWTTETPKSVSPSGPSVLFSAGEAWAQGVLQE